MIFTETKLKGAFVIDIERREDSRGFFARAFCQHEFAAHGLKPIIAQANIAFNQKKGTMRGMHFQFPPAAETKFVRAHARRHPRYLGGPSAGKPDLLAARRCRTQRRELPRGLRARSALPTATRSCGTKRRRAIKWENSTRLDAEGGLLYNDPRLGCSGPFLSPPFRKKTRPGGHLSKQELEIKRRMGLVPSHSLRDDLTAD